MARCSLDHFCDLLVCFNSHHTLDCFCLSPLSLRNLITFLFGLKTARNPGKDQRIHVLTLN